MRGNSLFYLLILILSFYSCRKTSKEVAEKGINTYIKKSGINKGVKVKDVSHLFNTDKSSIKKLSKLSSFELETLSSDLKKYPVFRSTVIKDPGLIDAYKVVVNNKTVRTEIKYLKEVNRQLTLYPNKKPELILLNNLNYNKAGTVFKEVPFVTKRIKYERFDLKGVFPDFTNFKVFETTLKRKNYLSNDKTQFKLAKNELYKAYTKNPEKIEHLLKKINENASYELNKKIYSGEKLLRKQISDIKNPANPNVFGTIWHHSEREGVLELISHNIHNDVRHTGGRAIWGGGSTHR